MRYVNSGFRHEYAISLANLWLVQRQEGVSQIALTSFLVEDFHRFCKPIHDALRIIFA
jgi:hypothetical protein